MLQITNSFPQIQTTIIVSQMVLVSYRPFVCKDLDATISMNKLVYIFMFFKLPHVNDGYYVFDMYPQNTDTCQSNWMQSVPGTVPYQMFISK